MSPANAWTSLISCRFIICPDQALLDFICHTKQTESQYAKRWSADSIKTGRQLVRKDFLTISPHWFHQHLTGGVIHSASPSAEYLPQKKKKIRRCVDSKATRTLWQQNTPLRRSFQRYNPNIYIYTYIYMWHTLAYCILPPVKLLFCPSITIFNFTNNPSCRRTSRITLECITCFFVFD